MSRFFLPRHGRTHLPGGSDPVPTAESSGGFPNIVEIPFWHVHAISDFDRTGFGTVTTDSTSLKNFYRESTAQNNYIQFMLMLGPQGSNWRFYLLHNRGSDYGQVDLSWQTPAPYNATTAPEIPEDAGTTGTFYAQSGITPTAEGYVAVADQNRNSYIGEFVIGGAPGDLHTGWGADHPDLASELSTGGPGMWRAQLKVATKHASSSGYRSRIQSFLAIRTDIWQFP